MIFPTCINYIYLYRICSNSGLVCYRSPLLPSEYRSNSMSGVRNNKTSLMSNLGMGAVGAASAPPTHSPSHKTLPSNSSNEGRISSSEGRDRKTPSESDSEKEDLEITIPLDGNETTWTLGN